MKKDRLNFFEKMKIQLDTYLDFFAGYGGFHKGLEEAGFKFKKTYFSEIDQHAIANYRYNFPNSEYLGAVENVLESGIRADIITFGSPCQDFSLAGKRAGLKGGRSSLIEYPIEYIRRFRPAVFIWENVKGAFSSAGGADFWAIVKAFAGIGGYRLQWQLVNTVWWLPQNRERIFLVGLAGDASGCEIFPIGESNGRTDEGATETPNARCFTAGGNSGGHHSGMTLIRHRSDQPYRAGDIAPTIRNSDKAEVRILQTNKSGQTFEKEESGTLRSGASANYQVVAQRGRPINGKNEQQLEPNETGATNALTSVQKDNLIVHNMQPRSGDPKKGGTGHLTRTDGVAYNVDTGNTNAVEFNSSIRRLTPRECEALQGLPRDWTKYGNYDRVVKEISDTQRYKLCGNGVSIPPVKAIGEKLMTTSINY